MLRRHHQLTARLTHAQTSLWHSGNTDHEAASPVSSMPVGMSVNAMQLGQAQPASNASSCSINQTHQKHIAESHTHSASLSDRDKRSSLEPAGNYASSVVASSLSGSSSISGSCASGSACKTYGQWKQEGGEYSRQWQELQRQPVFSAWMRKPEQLQAFTVPPGGAA